MIKENAEQNRLDLEQCPEIRDLKTLTGCIVHDVNNILMAIKGNVSLIRTDLAQGKPSAKRLENIDECIQNASELTHEILSFIKNEKAPKEKTNLNSVIKKIIRIYGRMFKGISIEAEYEKDILITHVNRSQVERAILNLFINAWKAMPKGGHLHIRTQNLSTADNLKIMKVNQHQHYVKIIIADTGHGMDQETQKKIFEPFFTNRPSNRPELPGVGIGLTSVQRIVDDHDGFIHMNSQKNQGTIFGVYLPA